MYRIVCPCDGEFRGWWCLNVAGYWEVITGFCLNHPSLNTCPGISDTKHQAQVLRIIGSIHLLSSGKILSISLYLNESYSLQLKEVPFCSSILGLGEKSTFPLSLPYTSPFILPLSSPYLSALHLETALCSDHFSHPDQSILMNAERDLGFPPKIE